MPSPMRGQSQGDEAGPHLSAWSDRSLELAMLVEVLSRRSSSSSSNSSGHGLTPAQPDAAIAASGAAADIVAASASACDFQTTRAAVETGRDRVPSPELPAVLLPR